MCKANALKTGYVIDSRSRHFQRDKNSSPFYIRLARVYKMVRYFFVFFKRVYKRGFKKEIGLSQKPSHLADFFFCFFFQSYFCVCCALPTLLSTLQCVEKKKEERKILFFSPFLFPVKLLRPVMCNIFGPHPPHVMRQEKKRY
jgi:hypothetical protein